VNIPTTVIHKDNLWRKSWHNENGQLHREDGPAVEHSDGTKEWYLNDKKYTEQEFKKMQKTYLILRELASDWFILEDDHSSDYCKYCNRNYGNYEKFGHSKKSIKENHKDDCLYRLANEVLYE